jgi:hypothetical protein
VPNSFDESIDAIITRVVAKISIDGMLTSQFINSPTKTSISIWMNAEKGFKKSIL